MACFVGRTSSLNFTEALGTGRCAWVESEQIARETKKLPVKGASPPWAASTSSFLHIQVHPLLHLPLQAADVQLLCRSPTFGSVIAFISLRALWLWLLLVLLWRHKWPASACRKTQELPAEWGNTHRRNGWRVWHHPSVYFHVSVHSVWISRKWVSLYLHTDTEFLLHHYNPKHTLHRAWKRKDGGGGIRGIIHQSPPKQAASDAYNRCPNPLLEKKIKKTHTHTSDHRPHCNWSQNQLRVPSGTFSWIKQRGGSTELSAKLKHEGGLWKINEEIWE